MDRYQGFAKRTVARTVGRGTPGTYGSDPETVLIDGMRIEIEDLGNGSTKESRYRLGALRWECSLRDGWLQDSPDGAPAVRRFRRDGSLRAEVSYDHDRLGPKGIERRFRRDGTLRFEARYWGAPEDGDTPLAIRNVRRDGTLRFETPILP